MQQWLTREEGVEGHNLKHDTAHTPHVHLVVVVAISQQALRRPVPAAQTSNQYNIRMPLSPAGIPIRCHQSVVP
jgi:hypothetical protein